jgi:hypothetical protein
MPALRPARRGPLYPVPLDRAVLLRPVALREGRHHEALQS